MLTGSGAPLRKRRRWTADERAPHASALEYVERLRTLLLEDSKGRFGDADGSVALALEALLRGDGPPDDWTPEQLRVLFATFSAADRQLSVDPQLKAWIKLEILQRLPLSAVTRGIPMSDADLERAVAGVVDGRYVPPLTV